MPEERATLYNERGPAGGGDRLFKCRRGVGPTVYAPDRGASSGGSASGSEGGRNARYAYLAARLRNRQMTMEEATELFTIMQGMLQTSEAARAALMRSPPPPPSSAFHPAPAARPPAPPPSGSGDDLLLVGLLAMGAGAGLLAAMTKRIQDVTAPSGPPASAPPNSRSASQKG